ncbi:MAG: S1C family serine protease [Flavobacteriales bacterium]
MKQKIQLFMVALIAGATTLGGYLVIVKNNSSQQELNKVKQEEMAIIPTHYSSGNSNYTNLDFTEAAEQTVHAVVHVKNTSIRNQPTNALEYMYGIGRPKAMIGSGSGVIISPDGYIVTNNHVIANASQLEVTLNDNKTYQAELIGNDPKTDIALIKIDAENDLPYVTFGDSNEVKIGEWVLAVGNPFNLTSTVTAGIISAKSRDLNEFDGNSQSFLQTDAAVNRGNSGGALVNTKGELIGINTAITSETGSYVGYSFAVPSNNARKIIEDIMEYGNVQRGILGITGGNLNSKVAENLGISETQGVYVDSVEENSGAKKGGILKGDIITSIDGLKITKFSDLVGYLGSKHPSDVVQVTVSREGQEKIIPVTLVKLNTYELELIGLEVKNCSKKELKKRGVDYGVKISRALNEEMKQYDLVGNLILKIDNQKVKNIEDVKQLMENRKSNNPLKLTFLDRNNETNTFIFR